HYLIHGENGFHETRFGMLLRALRDGKSSEEALRLAYPHILDEEWDKRLAAHVRPMPNRALIASNPNIVEGICFRIPPAQEAEAKPKRRPANPAAIAAMLDDLERVGIFKRHSGWLPQEIVDVEAAKRPRKAAPGPAG